MHPPHNICHLFTFQVELFMERVRVKEESCLMILLFGADMQLQAAAAVRINDAADQLKKQSWSILWNYKMRCFYRTFAYRLSFGSERFCNSKNPWKTISCIKQALPHTCTVQITGYIYIYFNDIIFIITCEGMNRFGKNWDLLRWEWVIISVWPHKGHVTRMHHKTHKKIVTYTVGFQILGPFEKICVLHFVLNLIYFPLSFVMTVLKNVHQYKNFLFDIWYVSVTFQPQCKHNWFT